MQTDIDTLKLRINQLHLEHRDLDDVIARLGEKPGQDQLQLQRLKKKKLLSFKKLSNLKTDKLAALIKPAGYFNIKARRLKNLLEFIDKNYKGNPSLMQKINTA